MRIPNKPGIYELDDIEIRIFPDVIEITRKDSAARAVAPVLVQQPSPPEPADSFDLILNPPPLSKSIPQAIRNWRKIREVEKEGRERK